MIKNIFLTILIVYSVTLTAQNIDLKGVVRDSLQTPLSYANVIAKPKDVTKNMSFAITDEQGRYRLNLKSKNTYTVSVSHIGYKTVDFVIKPSPKNIQKNIVLLEAKNKLDEVVIELPVTVKGDTTIYNTNKFVNGSERKLKNVLKKLPGVQVDKNGNVTVQGKKVTKMLVDGKPFFGGSTKLAVENIPADAVDKVEAIKNYNQVAFLKGLNDSNKLAMNIKLKEDKKRFVFGDVAAGKGNENYYKANANLFYYSPNTTMNFISSSNTIAEKIFTFKDYLSFKGDVNSVFKNDFNSKDSNLSQFLEKSDITKSNEQFAALNLTRTLSAKLDVSGYAIFSHIKTNSFVTNKNAYAEFLEQQENSTITKNTLGIGKVNFSYRPNINEQWYFKTQVKRSKNNNKNALSSIVNTNDNEINTDKNGITSSINQNIEWHKKGKGKHTYSAIANFTFNDNNLHSLWNTTNPIFNGLIPIDNGQNTIVLKQSKNAKNYNFTTVFKDFWVLNRKNHIYVTLGNIYQKNKFFTSDSQLLDNGTERDFMEDGFGNDTQFNFTDLFLGVHYKFKTGIFTFKQGVYLHKYDWEINQNTNFNKKKWIALPDFLMKIKINNSKSLAIKYNLKTDFTDASSFSNRLYLNTYNSVFRGNEKLENELYHSASINYGHFSFYKGLFLNANLNYTKKKKGYNNTIEFYENANSIDRFLTIKMIENPSESYNASVFLEKKIKSINYRLLGDYMKSNYIQNINNNFVTNKNTDYTFDVGFETLFDKLPTIETGFRRNIGKYTSSNSTSKFVTNEPYVNIDYDFLDGFVFNFDYTHYNYQNKAQNIDNKYNLANAVLSYQKEDSPWMFKLTTQNLFDTTFKQSNSFSDYLITDSKTYIMPRVVLFSIGYKL